MAEKTKTKPSDTQRANNMQPKKSMVLRVIVLCVAALMFAGAIVLPFMSAGIFE